MIHLVLADDHHVIRKGLRALLEAERDFSILAEAGDGLEAVKVVEEMQPDVLVVDITMPGLDGLSVTRRVRKRMPEIQVVVLSMHAHEAYVLEALRNGALGYVLKTAAVADLMKAIRMAATGRRFLSAPLTELALDAYAEKARTLGVDSYQALTAREQEVMQLTAEGYTAAQIAERLSISRRTVEAHRANLMRKLGLSKLADVMRYALERGLIPMKSAPPASRAAS